MEYMLSRKYSARDIILYKEKLVKEKIVTEEKKLEEMKKKDKQE